MNGISPGGRNIKDAFHHFKLVQAFVMHKQHFSETIFSLHYCAGSECLGCRGFFNIYFSAALLLRDSGSLYDNE